jgi:hypothetical protein
MNNSKLLSIELIGGLGNQLFQIFTIYAYHLRLGENKQDFRIAFPETKADKRPTYWNGLLWRVFFLVNRDEPVDQNTYANMYCIYQPQTYTQLTPYAKAQIPEENVGILLKGYFQDHRYFDLESATILHLFAIPSLRTNILTAKAPELLDTTSKHTISMHFRRGDYVQQQCYHPLMTEYYYIGALNHIIHQLDAKKPIVVYCFYEKADEPDVSTMAANIRASIATPCQFVMAPALWKNLYDWEEMLAMSGCQHHIIANSSFSWWGAYLHTAMEKSAKKKPIVCIPDRWFGHQLYYLDTTGYQVPGWTAIQAFPTQWPPCAHRP